ncbi:ketopantoate reductase family protein [Salinarchaeum laminariae]|uniref:ketopantoate reductase family protein n=1 Tax=Salinarchaeum laminariae TaxID=869888 RepID=UPI0020BF350B|nr:ketopantoate reductase C-terminal domain-containing protein [Salinarchaeum laminariae]
MDVLVLGAGSLGSLVGGLLSPDHDVTLIGRETHVAAIRESGLAIDGALEGVVHPAATTDPDGASADLAIVSVKAYDTQRAADALAACDVDAVWSLQNGLGNEATLASVVDAPVLAGTATYGAERRAPGSVTCTGLGEVAIGPRPGTPTPDADASLAERIGRDLSNQADSVGSAAPADRFDGHPRVVVDATMPERLWSKLAVNVAINPVTALARVENGALAGADIAVATGEEVEAAGEGTVAAGQDEMPADEPRDTARRAAREVARVAQASGVALTESDAVAELDEVVEATAANRSSMLQDVEAGRRTEIDAIAGSVIDRAEAHDVPVPVTRTLAALLMAWEQGAADQTE